MKFKEDIKRILKNRKASIRLIRSQLKKPFYLKKDNRYQINYLKEEEHIQNILDLLD
ncbi:MAG: hypothetical protein JKY48_10295 [Flavobacteriales bacterium]|nr:hypothetical protein [Flavobacteriales bacterium]